MTTTTTITVQSSRGPKTVETPYSDEEACRLLVERVASGQMARSKFASDLARQYSARGLSSKQMAWVQILVVEFEQYMAVDSSDVELGHNLIQRFDKAAENLKYPKIRFENVERGSQGIGPVKFVRSGPKAKEPGSIAVTDGGRYGDNVYFGRITRDGVFVTSRSCTTQVKDFVKQFEAEPAEVAAIYGKSSGNCVFCSRELTDDRSISVGYGPVCAGHYNLPWGEVAP